MCGPIVHIETHNASDMWAIRFLTVIQCLLDLLSNGIFSPSYTGVTRELFVVGVSDRGMLVTGIIDQISSKDGVYVLCDTKTTSSRRSSRSRRSVSEVQVSIPHLTPRLRYTSDYTMISPRETLHQCNSDEPCLNTWNSIHPYHRIS